MSAKTTPYVKVCPGCGLTTYVRVPSQHLIKIMAATGNIRSFWPEATDRDLRIIDTGMCDDCFSDSMQAIEDLIQGDLKNE